MNARLHFLAAALVTVALTPLTAARADAVVGGYQVVPRVSVSTGGTLTDPWMTDTPVVKTGEGDLTVPADLFLPLGSRTIDVYGGLVTVTTGGTVPTLTRPSVIDTYAAMWLSAKSDERQISYSSGTDVSRWYDVRETDTSAPQHWYAQPQFLQDSYPAPSLQTYTDATGNEQPAVYFNDYASGTAMSWYLPDGTLRSPNDLPAIFSLFVVHCEKNRIGAIFGCTESVDADSDGNPFHPYEYGHKESSFWAAYARITASSAYGRAYRNGEAITLSTDTPLKDQFELYNLCATPLDSHAIAKSPWGYRVNAFCNDRNLTDIPRQGGGYICEAIVFTNVLSETERVQIQAYLMQKWGLGANTAAEDPVVRYRQAIQLEVADGETLPTASGEMKVKYTGTAERALPHVKDGVAPTVLDSSTLSALYASGRAPVTLAGGRSVTAERVWSIYPSTDKLPWLRLSFADTDAHTCTISGGQEVSVNNIASDLEKLTISAGRVVLQKSDFTGGSLTDEPYGDITLANASFEQEPAAGGDFHLWTAGAAIDVPGWEFCPQLDKTSSDLDADSVVAWIRTGVAGAETGRAWFLTGKAPDGAAAVGLRKYSAIRQQVTLPASGKYRVTFWCCGRCDTDSSGRPHVCLIDGDGNEIATFCSYVRRPRQTTMTQIGYETMVEKAGTYWLYIGNTAGTGDGAMTIDDVHLSRVDTGRLKTWPIPGGNFEIDNETDYAACSSTWATWSAANVHSKWTFTHLPETLSVALGTFWQTLNPVPNNGTDIYMNRLLYAGRLPLGGEMKLAFLKGGTAATTFTPPAGRWRLRAAVSTYGGATVAVAASVVRNDVTNELGLVTNLDSTKYWYEDTEWPNAFEADGATPVTLVLTHTNTVANLAMTVDDLELVEATGFEGAELVQNGSFEDNGWTQSAKYWDLLNSDGEVITPSGNLGARNGLGDIYDGTFLYLLENGYSARQTITFPAAGYYLLHIPLAARTSFISQSGTARANVSIGSGDDCVFSVSNIETHFAKHNEHEYLFYVPSAGARDLKITANCTISSWQVAVVTDGISIHRVFPTDCPTIPKEAKVSIASGAKLYLGFGETNRVSRVVLGGVRQPNGSYVNAQTAPDYIEGPGSLYVTPGRGLVIILR